MNQILAVVFLVFLPACATLNCYVCSTDMPGCNDPFNAKAYTVTTDSSSSNTYCVKARVTSSLTSRYGSSFCVNTPFVFGVGMACCQTDLCNGAQGTYQIPLLIALSFLIILFKIY